MPEESHDSNSVVENLLGTQEEPWSSSCQLQLKLLQVAGTLVFKTPLCLKIWKVSIWTGCDSVTEQLLNMQKVVTSLPWHCHLKWSHNCFLESQITCIAVHGQAGSEFLNRLFRETTPSSYLLHSHGRKWCWLHTGIGILRSRSGMTRSRSQGLQQQRLTNGDQKQDWAKQGRGWTQNWA